MESENILLSISEAAHIARCHPQKIHRAIRSGNLKAVKVGWNWVIKRVDLDAFLYEIKGM